MRHALFARLLRCVRFCAAHVVGAYTALLEFTAPCTRTKILMSDCFQIGRRASVPVVVAMLLTSCGYHLVGHGNGAGVIPADVETVSLQATNEAAKSLLVELKRRISNRSEEGYLLVEADKVEDAEAHAAIRLEQASEQFVPSAYDASGVATQYRLTISGNILVYRSGKLLWKSGVISESGEVFVVGGPPGAEAARNRIQRDLRAQWASRAWSRLSSGF